MPVGTPIYATKWGIIVKEGIDRVYGRYIEILHIDGYESVYGHLSSFYIWKEGDFVVAGTLIAYSGGDPDKDPTGSGWSSGPHLHYEVRVPGHLDNNLYNIDPLKYLGLEDEK